MTGLQQQLQPPAPRTTSQRVAQLGYLQKLLALKGESAARDIRQRISSGKGVIAKGLYFDPVLLEEALQLWQGATTKVQAHGDGAAGRNCLKRKAPPHSDAEGEGEPLRGRLPARIQGNLGPELPDAAAGSGTGVASGTSPETSRVAAVEWPQEDDVSTPRPCASRPSSGGSCFQRLLEASRQRAMEGAGHDIDGASLTPCRTQRRAMRFQTRSPERPAKRASSPLTAWPSPLARSGASGGPQKCPPSAALPPSPPALRKFWDSPGAAAGGRLAGSPPREKAVESSRGEASGAQAAGGSGKAAVDPSVATAQSPPENGSVKELKMRLSERNIDFSGCVEKNDLQALWTQFQTLRKQPLQELQASSAARNGPVFQSADDYACFLMSAPASSSTSPLACTSAAADLTTPPPRGEEALKAEVARILCVQRNGFSSAAAWGRAVLGLASSCELSDVQRCYRGLIKRLHPDKVGNSPRAMRALELVREARDLCERNLLRVVVPGPPRKLRSELLCDEPGRRQFRLTWSAPQDSEASPVRRYVLAAVDPAYGRALTFTTLEPEYSQELHRFVSVAELTSFVLSEVELQKMPSLWEQSHAVIQVAAGNEAGLSRWATLEVPLLACGPHHAGTAAAAVPGTRPAAAQARSSPSAGSPTSPSSAGEGGTPELRTSDWRFEMELRRRRGEELRCWLTRQKKPPLVSWLRSLRMPSTGTKEELVQRVLELLGENSGAG